MLVGWKIVFQPTYKDGVRVNKHPPMHHVGWMVCGQKKLKIHCIPDPCTNHLLKDKR